MASALDARKNMDSVFADCTQDELEFEAMFDDDDSIIDTVAGFNESGDPITGADPDYMLEDATCPNCGKTPCECEDANARDGKVDPEDTKNVEGVKTDVLGAANESAKEDEDMEAYMESIIVDSLLEEAEDPIQDECDDAERAGDVNHNGKPEGSEDYDLPDSDENGEKGPYSGNSAESNADDTDDFHGVDESYIDSLIEGSDYSDDAELVNSVLESAEEDEEDDESVDESYIDSLVNESEDFDADDDDIDAIINGDLGSDDIVPDDVQTNESVDDEAYMESILVNSVLEDAEADDEADDTDIEAIDNNDGSTSDSDLDYEYSDDELVDMVLNDK